MYTSAQLASGMSKRWCTELEDSDVGRMKMHTTTTRHGSHDKFPACWKEMKGVAGRFSVMKYGNIGECLDMDAVFARDILSNAFPRHFPSDMTPVKKPKRIMHSKYLEKRNYYDLTMSDSDESVNEEKKETGNEYNCFPLSLQHMVDKLETKHIRILEIEQIQNVQSHLMQVSFMEANEITAPCEIVYHGTDGSALDSIVGEGLRGMYAKRTLYGRGTYVSRSFEVAKWFATADNDGFKHIMVVKCQVGLVKQVGGETAQESFYSDPCDGTEKILYNTKEVKTQKYLIIGNDSQLLCCAILKIQELNDSTDQPFSMQTVSQLGNSLSALASILLKSGSSNGGVGGGVGSLVMGGVGGVGNSVSSGIGNSTQGSAANSRFVANMLPNPLSTSLAHDKVKNPSIDSEAQRHKEKLARMTASVVTFENDLKLQKSARLIACQAPLPLANIDLSGCQHPNKHIRKGDLVILSKMSLTNTYLEDKEGIVKLIVQECPEKNNVVVFMVEMLDNKFFQSIILANQRKEKKYKQTCYSRYGNLMQEHYFLCKFSQINLKSAPL